jgi:tRNA nucleotidyltransferase/poly(A) polymerase
VSRSDSGEAETLELHPPEGLKEVAGTLERQGWEAWAVGGAVRDELVGRSRADWDLATNARPEEVQRIFRRTVPIGVEHGTVGVLASDEVLYEVTTFRHDVETDGRHAVVRFSDTIDEDLARRDFTINAVAWRPSTGELRDPHGGREDLRDGVLRAVGEPEDRFSEDYLRVLRGLRFAGRYRMELEPKTRTALERAVPGTEGLSAERVREELEKVVTDRRPSETLRLYRDVGVLEVWYPELSQRAASDPRWELRLGAVDEISRGRPALRVACLLADLDEDAETRSRQAREVLERLKFSNRDTERICHLVRHVRPMPAPTDSDAEVRTWIAEVGEDDLRDLFRLQIAEARASAAEERQRYLVYLWRRVHEQLLEDHPLTLSGLAVDGGDLLDMGVEEGPFVGVLLQELHARVLEDPSLNRRDRLLEMTEELIEIGHLRGPEAPTDRSEAPAGGSAAHGHGDANA